MKFENIYSQTSDSQKLKFLDAIIAHNKALMDEFVAFSQADNQEKSGLSSDRFLEIVHSTQSKYRSLFEEVDTENPDWEMYHPPHSGYIEEWEAYQMASEQEFEAIFNGFLSLAIDKIIGQCPAEVMAMLIGLYEATQDAEVTDDVGSFNDVNEYLLEEHINTLNTLIGKIRLSAIASSTIYTTFELFFEYCTAKYPGDFYFASHFEQLLLALAEKTDDAQQLLSLLNHSGVELQALPELVLLLNKKAGNNTEWLQSARQFYRGNAPVAKQLLEYYFERDKDAFVRIARELFPTDKYLWSEFLQHYITPQLNEELFVQVFWQLTVRHNNIEYYNRMREYLSETDLKKLIKELNWEKVFVVKILDVEKRYADIKAIVEKDADDWNYAGIIEPILTVYPEFCFQHIKNKSINTLDNQRGRDVYQRIAKWLSLAQTIPGFKIETRELIQQLYNHKPNLPALKDEMRQAGLMG